MSSDEQPKPRLLLVGTTGHIGCAVLSKLVDERPELAIRALVRSESQANAILGLYPRVETVLGALENVELMQQEASRACIVINCAPDVLYPDGIKAILRGLQSRQEKGFYIHTSGAASIWNAPNGDFEGPIWDDVGDIDRLRNLPSGTTHLATDNIVRGGNTDLVSTAIVAPPWVMGLGPSPVHPTPLTFSDIFYVIRTLKTGYIVGQGANRADFVEVNHLAQLYLLLVRDALHRPGAASDGGSVPSDRASVATWGPEGYYFLSTVELSFREFMSEHLLPAIEKTGSDILASPTEAPSVSVDRITELVRERLGGFLGAELWSRHIAEGMGVSMRCRGSRAEKVFGFKPTGSLRMNDSVAAFLQSA